jgi:hypothetical protein
VIARALTFAEFDPPQAFSSATEASRVLDAGLRSGVATVPIKSAVTPTQEPDGTAEAVQRVLPELIKLDRYEHRFCMLRDRAVLAMVDVINNNNCRLVKE